MRIGIALLAALLPVAAAAQNLVVNGNFETGDFTGYTTSGDIHVGRFGTAGGTSSYVAYTTTPFLPGILPPAVFTQALATQTGTPYRIDFLGGGSGAGISSTGFRIEILFGGVSIFNQNLVVPGASDNFTLRPISILTPAATGASTELTFRMYASSGTTAVDNIAVVATPEPATVALLATGLLGVAGTARRRRVG
jgi:hypothetical protein